jgi:hypothetical protein
VGSVACAQLAQDVANVLLDGIEHDNQLVRNLAVCVTGGHEAQHLQLALRQLFDEHWFDVMRGAPVSEDNVQARIIRVRPATGRMGVEIGPWARHERKSICHTSMFTREELAAHAQCAHLRAHLCARQPVLRAPTLRSEAAIHAGSEFGPNMMP